MTDNNTPSEQGVGGSDIAQIHRWLDQIERVAALLITSLNGIGKTAVQALSATIWAQLKERQG
jgi:hypothetical protein